MFLEQTVFLDESASGVASLNHFLGRHRVMDRTRERLRIENKLARCRELAREFHEGHTAEMIRDMEDELRQQLRDMGR